LYFICIVFVLRFLLSIFFFFFPRLFSAVADWMLHLGCRSETCCTSWNYGTQKIAKNSPSAHHSTRLSGYIFATKARIDNRKKTPPHVLTIWWTSPTSGWDRFVSLGHPCKF